MSKAYGAGPTRVPVLHDISLNIPAGGLVAIVGPSGSGKSTLLNLIGLLDQPDSGEIRLDGQRVAFRSAAEAARLRNRMIGFVFQSFQLLPRLTAWENVALPLLYRGVPRAERRVRALAMLESVDLADRVDHRPSALSGGQCQRVALARALIGEPRLILADEPTGSLDTATGATVMDLLRDLNRRLGTTIVMVTHDPDLAARCNALIEIRDGRIRTQREEAT
ncbi:ABC transporter ATP-binding protein [Caulobacter sp. Root655]|uniref:ABC transporter ATP-binding protein n=1 Tax=Caulobacter sp. Root655 TaxID=1736578 RepID=UPI001F409F19|nr:ABC transporter ATP-binding protein [Caulobacter sp. Root655]